MKLNPELLHDFHRRHSPEANFSKPERVDGKQSSSGTRRTCVRRRRNSLQLLDSIFIDKLFSSF